MKIKRLISRLFIGFVALVVLLLAVSFLVNRSLPTASKTADLLSEAEEARIVEFDQLRQSFGDSVWPGWGTADIPVVLYNESYVFLLGAPDDSAGWRTVPQNERRGGPWEMVHGVGINTYYRQPLPADGQTPQAFTVKIGNQYALSMTTKEWMEISFANQMRQDLPAFLAPVFPYPLVTGLFIRGSDGYLSLLAHESFHAYQGTVAEAMLAAAETGVSNAEDSYPWAETEEDWQIELDLLVEALRAGSDEETAELARQFIAQRARRREEANLSTASIDYERQREWLEGLGRYVELELWRQASLSEDYIPSAGIQTDPDFDSYQGFDRRWSQEVDQIGRMAADWGDGRFYYSGMAQAVLLDRLMPGWKEMMLEDGLFLEELLARSWGESGRNDS